MFELMFSSRLILYYANKKINYDTEVNYYATR
jgi:hypothetical protein